MDRVDMELNIVNVNQIDEIFNHQWHDFMVEELKELDDTLDEYYKDKEDMQYNDYEDYNWSCYFRII